MRHVSGSLLAADDLTKWLGSATQWSNFYEKGWDDVSELQ